MNQEIRKTGIPEDSFSGTEGSCVPNLNPLYYAQQREDEWITENLGHLLPTDGFYVDIGCAHPFTTSNTAFLRDRKWEGLAIDGHRTWIDEWRGIPAFRCAVVVGSHPGGKLDDGESAPVSFFENSHNPWVSRIGAQNGSQERVGIPIEELLEFEEIGQFDFLSIDVEGSEFDILNAFNFDIHDPAIVIAEYNSSEFGVDKRLLPLMESRGYKLRYENPINMIFTR